MEQKLKCEEDRKRDKNLHPKNVGQNKPRTRPSSTYSSVLSSLQST
jgi:hypothetical protein